MSRIRFGWARKVSALSVVLATALVGCATGGQSSNDGRTNTLVWALDSGDAPVVTASKKEWNAANPHNKVTVRLFPNDEYKQKLPNYLGAENGPTLFINWGGGSLKSYVKDGTVEDLTDDLNTDLTWKHSMLDSVLDTATIQGETYGIPMNSMQPVVLYYNKSLFSEIGAKPPKTWNELLSVVSRFRSAGITPFALAGESQWPELMWLEYLVDRIGGPGVFDAISAGQVSAWNNDAVIQATGMIQELVDAGGFAKDFTSVGYDTGKSSALLYQGKAAMQLMGSWDYAQIESASPSFVKDGKLGWASFPAVAGGKGSPSNIVGNPANYYSLSSDVSDEDRAAAIDYLKNGVMSDNYINTLLKNGGVPPVNDLEEKIDQVANGVQQNWLTFIYKLGQEAPSFQLSWDQALSPKQAEAMLTNLDKIFRKEITPDDFALAMTKVAKSETG